MNNKGKDIVIAILIAILLIVIGFCIYLLVDKSYNVNCDSKNKVDTTSKPTEKVKDNTLANTFKEKALKDNENLLAKNQNNTYSKLTDFVITKIEEVTVDGIPTKYNIEAKYLCDNQSWNCVYFSQVSDSITNQKNEDGYYTNTFYYYIGEPYGSSLIAQPLPRTGPVSEYDGHKVNTKTVYE